MKFIFPQNYHFKNKILGVIDYTTAFINIIWDLFIFIIVNFIFKSLSIKISILIIFCFPLLLFSFVGFNGENIFFAVVLAYDFRSVERYFESVRSRVITRRGDECARRAVGVLGVNRYVVLNLYIVPFALVTYGLNLTGHTAKPLP